MARQTVRLVLLRAQVSFLSARTEYSDACVLFDNAGLRRHARLYDVGVAGAMRSGPPDMPLDRHFALNRLVAHCASATSAGWERS